MLLVTEELCIVARMVIAYGITYGTHFLTDEWVCKPPFLLQMLPGFVLGMGAFLPSFSS